MLGFELRGFAKAASDSSRRIMFAMDPIKLYLGVKAVIMQDGKLLVLERFDSKGQLFWDMPGGRMAKGEDMLQTLRRELREELPSLENYTIGDLLTVHKKPEVLNDGTELCILYYRVLAPTFEVVLSDEHHAYHWMTETEVAALPARFPQVYLPFFKN